MPEFSEDDLRSVLADTDAPNTLDAKRVIARSRARRLPVQIAAGAGGVLVVAGIGVLVVQPSLFTSHVSTVSIVSEQSDADGSAGSAADSSAAPQAVSQKRAPADKINLCTGPVSEVAPSFYALQLDVEFPQTAAAGSDSIEGTVRLTNTGTTPIVGYTAAAPALTLSHNNVVLWHSNGPMIQSAVMVDLQPGESLEYAAAFTPVSCTMEADMAEGFPADLPPVPAGSYELSALIDFNADSTMLQPETPELDLISGPRSTVVLQ